MNGGKREKEFVGEGHWGFSFQKCAVVNRLNEEKSVQEWRGERWGRQILLLAKMGIGDDCWRPQRGGERGGLGINADGGM